MDKMMTIQITVIAGLFGLFCLFVIINMMQSNSRLKKAESKMKTSSKIVKRKNTNVYEIKTTRGQ